MSECAVEAWNYWLVAGLVLATAGIVFIATWTYMQDRHNDLLRGNSGGAGVKPGDDPGREDSATGVRQHPDGRPRP